MKLFDIGTDYQPELPSLGSRRLWQACLEDAIDVLTRKNLASSRIFQETETWMGTVSYEVSGFDGICQMLGLDPSMVRNYVRDRQ